MVLACVLMLTPGLGRGRLCFKRQAWHWASASKPSRTEPCYLGVRTVLRNLRDPGPARSQRREGGEKVALIECLERARDDGAALNPERFCRGTVVRKREGRRRIALVGDQRKTMVDDVEVAVEQPPTTAHRTDCQAFCRTWTARLASRSLVLAP